MQNIYLKVRQVILTLILLSIFNVSRAESYTSSVLAQGDWVKIQTTDAGVYKLTYGELQAMGIENPSEVRIYGNGGYELPTMNNEYYPTDLSPVQLVRTDDAVIFYAHGNTSWTYNSTTQRYEHHKNIYSDLSFYYLSSNGGELNDIKVEEEIIKDADVEFSLFDVMTFHESQELNLLYSGRNWYGESLGANRTMSFDFDLSDYQVEGDMIVTVSAAVRNSVTSDMKIYIDGSLMGTTTFSSVFTTDKYALYARSKDISYVADANDQPEIKVTNASSGGTAYIDHICVETQASLQLNSRGVLIQQKQSLGYDKVLYKIGNASSSTIVIDVTDPYHHFQKNVNVESGVASLLSTPADTIRRYFAFNLDEDFLSPSVIGPVQGVDLHGLPCSELIIVTHPKFLDDAETLAQFHRDEDGMEVLVVTSDQVFESFSSGMPDPSAIRNFVKHYYNREPEEGNKPLKHLLLYGDGTYDNRDHYNNDEGYVITYQTLESLNPNSSFVSDDFFVLLDESEGEYYGSIDLGVGRIPAKTSYESEIVLQKILTYSSAEAMGDWRNSLTFIADDEDSNMHLDQTEAVVAKVVDQSPGFNIEKIYLDAFSQSVSTYPDVNKAINNAVDEGTLILNYIGHANSTSLAHEDVMNVSDIDSWVNDTRFPIFVTASCEFSPFDADETSAGERILLREGGGGIGLFSTTRVVYANANSRLLNNFYSNVFGHDEYGDNYRMGDIMRTAKNQTTNDTNKRSFVFLGDPAIRLAFPKYEVNTISVNGLVPGEDSIRISALEQVVVKAEIVDYKGDLVSTYSGEAISTVFDKEVYLETQGNDSGSSVTDYAVQNSVIYKGKSTITDGVFEFSFIVPKDIIYSIDYGKISYYVCNDVEDGNGATFDVKIGGTSENPVQDSDAPEIKVYLNDESFQSGDKVKKNNILLANLFDMSGINTIGAGIGHDITGILDSDYANVIELNQYYTSAVDDFTQGSLLYPLNDLEPGKHTLTVKAWDVQNNSAEETITFYVEEGFDVSEVYNAPNPVVDQTTFKITHNLPGESFDVTIEIFDFMGQKLHKIQQVKSSYQTTQIEVDWNVFDTPYLLRSQPNLIYIVKLTSDQGYESRRAGKLTIKRN